MRTECPDRYRCTVHDKLSPKETICFERSIAYVTNFCQEIDDLIAHHPQQLYFISFEKSRKLPILFQESTYELIEVYHLSTLQILWQI